MPKALYGNCRAEPFLRHQCRFTHVLRQQHIVHAARFLFLDICSWISTANDMDRSLDDIISERPV